jgi:hypothetical protein
MTEQDKLLELRQAAYDALVDAKRLRRQVFQVDEDLSDELLAELRIAE